MKVIFEFYKIWSKCTLGFWEFKFTLKLLFEAQAANLWFVCPMSSFSKWFFVEREKFISFHHKLYLLLHSRPASIFYVFNPFIYHWGEFSVGVLTGLPSILITSSELLTRRCLYLFLLIFSYHTLVVHDLVFLVLFYRFGCEGHGQGPRINHAISPHLLGIDSGFFSLLLWGRIES